MAKRKTKAPVEPTLEPTFDIIDTPVVAEVPAEVPAEAPVEEMELEKVTVAEEIKEEESVVEVVEVDEEPETIVEPVVKKSLTQKEMFEDAISKTPFTIYQNGILVCNYSAFLNIKTEAKYFEINNKKYSYTGIEIKYA